MDQNKLEKRLELFKRACREAGLKLTYQRQEIYRELVLSDDHPSAEILHARIKEKVPMISLDTVYRTLGTFARTGLIHRVETGESQARFEVIHRRHHHLICRQCLEITDFQWPSLDEISIPAELRRWGEIDSRNLVVYGICRRCRR